MASLYLHQPLKGPVSKLCGRMGGWDVPMPVFGVCRRVRGKGSCPRLRREHLGMSVREAPWSWSEKGGPLGARDARGCPTPTLPSGLPQCLRPKEPFLSHHPGSASPGTSPAPVLGLRATWG